MFLLALETSCDETSAAVIKDSQLLSNLVSSQEKIHAQYGGIVPEVAARKHIEIIIPIIKKALSEAKISLHELDAIAVTFGPGLITSLMIGVDTAKALAFALNKPIIPVNHLEGHIYANFIGGMPNFHSCHPEESATKDLPRMREAPIRARFFAPMPIEAQNDKSLDSYFPLLCLIVSGGHTELVYMPEHLKYKLLGETRDDAAGEAFDKVAKLLNIGYPGGPIISRLAEKGNPKKYKFPRPMLQSGDFDFSFSGLKTDVLRLVRSKHGLANFSLRQECELKLAIPQKEIANICASFQAAAVDTLIAKTLGAAKKYSSTKSGAIKTIALAGGVSANQSLRKNMAQAIKKELPKTQFLAPDLKFCTDNAAMIAQVAQEKLRRGITTAWNKLEVNANAQL